MLGTADSLKDRFEQVRSSGDEGFIAMMAVRALARNKFVSGGMSAAVVVGALTAANFLRTGSGIDVAADMSQAETVTESEITKIDTALKMQPLELEFTQTLTKQNMELDASIEVFGRNINLLPNPDQSATLEGVGGFQVEVPNTAYTYALNANGLTDVTVDTSKIKATLFWDEGQTRVIMSGDRERGFNDALGGVAQAIKGSSEVAEKFEQVDEEAKSLLRQEGQNDLVEGCDDEIQELTEEAVIGGVQQLYQQMRKADKLGNVTLKTPVDVDQFVQELEYDETLIKNAGEMKPGSNTCSVSADVERTNG